MKRPHTITVISWIFIAFGCISLVGGFVPSADSAAAQRVAEFKANHPIESGWVQVMRVLALVGGVFLLYGFNWARWLLSAWMGYHIILSVLHSPLQLVLHSLLFGAVLYFLFRPEASTYFRRTRSVDDAAPRASQ